MKLPTNREICEDLLAQLGITQSSAFEILGEDPVVPSPHRLGDASAAALAALGVVVANLWQHRTELEETIQTSVSTAIPQLMAIFMTTVNDVSISRLFEDPKLLGTSDFYRTKDGRFVFLLNTYPHLRDINCQVLKCPCEGWPFTTAIAEWDAFELEEVIGSQGGTCIVVRSRGEWLRSPMGSSLKDTPVIDIEKLSDSPAEALPKISDSSTGKPLGGIRILDNTHVIAGPMATRICAEYGAEVLLMSSPDHADPRTMTLETAIGKRSAFCDLSTIDGQEKFWTALKDADVYVSSYLSLDKRGYGPADLIKARPGLIYCDFHGWGKTGLWQQRGGFDQLACSATGFAQEEGMLRQDGRPSLPPTYLLNDYLAAILGAAGIAECLRRRATQGGSYRVHVNLSRIAMWVQSLGLFEKSEVSKLARPCSLGPDKKPDPGSIGKGAGLQFKEVDGPQGRTKYLPTQIAYTSGSIKPGFAVGSEPTGASEMAFLTRRNA